MGDASLNVKVTINRDFVKDTVKLIQVPATQAALTAAGRIKTLGRQNIRASYKNMGGLANAFRVDVYPDKYRGFFPKIFARVRTGYSAVFEEGAVIKGKPFLWLPLPAARKLMGRNRVQPKDWSRRYGKLALVKGKGKPILVGQYGLNPKAVASGKKRRLVGLRKTGAAYQGQATPLFVGIRMSKITAQWRLRAITLAESAKIPERIKKAVGNGAQ